MMEKPFVGKTYSLYGIGSNSDDYYEQLRLVADHCLTKTGSIEELLSVVLNITKNKGQLKRIAKASSNSTIESFLVHKLQKEFSPFTKSAAEHLRELPLKKRWDRTLATSEQQYHLYMLEIELQNRLNAKSFQNCDTKLAFLPHCLRDLKARMPICKIWGGLRLPGVLRSLQHQCGVENIAPAWSTALYLDDRKSPITLQEIEEGRKASGSIGDRLYSRTGFRHATVRSC